MELKRILYATDLPDNSSNGLRYAIELARTLRAALTVLHAVDHANVIYWAGATAGYLQEQLTKLVHERRRALRELVAHEGSAGMEIETLVVEGKPFEKILSVAEERGIDIIVLNLQSKGMLERAFIGSTAERVVRLAHIPVLSVPVMGEKPHGPL